MNCVEELKAIVNFEYKGFKPFILRFDILGDMLLCDVYVQVGLDYVYEKYDGDLDLLFENFRHEIDKILEACKDFKNNEYAKDISDFEVLRKKIMDAFSDKFPEIGFHVCYDFYAYDPRQVLKIRLNNKLDFEFEISGNEIRYLASPFVRSNSIYIERINLPEQIFKLITEKVKEVENEWKYFYTIRKTTRGNEKKI